MEKIKEQIEDAEISEEESDRSSLNLQQFMNDMRMFDEQLKDKSLSKPVFDFGASVVTNYLLWLVYAELLILNNRFEDGSADN